MPRFTITLPDELNEWVEDQVDENDSVAPSSKSEAARHALGQARQLDDVDASLTELVGARDRADEVEDELKSVRAERDDLRRQLMEANTRIDSANEIVEHVRDERTRAQRREEASLPTRAKWWVFGRETNDDE